MNGRTWLAVGGLIAGLAVGLGALGAHGFDTHSKKLYPDEAVRARRVENWETAVKYQMYHALALVAVGFGTLHRRSRLWDAAGGLFVAGVMLFSGSLYLIALSGVSDFKTASAAYNPLIAATPIGGVLMLLGWPVFIAAAWMVRER